MLVWVKGILLEELFLLGVGLGSWGKEGLIDEVEVRGGFCWLRVWDMLGGFWVLFECVLVFEGFVVVWVG